MINLFYKILVYFTQKWGLWVFHSAVHTIAAGYFLFFPARVAASVHFYRTLFPNRPGIYHIWCAWKQFHSFTSLYIDRYLLENSKTITYKAHGIKHLENCMKQKKGAVLLMSHAGSWEIAARLLRQKKIPLMLVMGEKQKEQIEAVQKQSLRKDGVGVISGGPENKSPLEIMEAMEYLKKGWILSMAGDRVRDPGQATVEVSFLGRQARLPKAPFALAAAAGMPVLVFFAFRTGPGRYRFEIHEPFEVKKSRYVSPKKEIEKAAQKYSDLLEKAVFSYPWQWYHFTSFIEG
jgi:lauroyl/myristoyl acyltransferase